MVVQYLILVVISNQPRKLRSENGQIQHFSRFPKVSIGEGMHRAHKSILLDSNPWLKFPCNIGIHWNNHIFHSIFAATTNVNPEDS